MKRRVFERESERERERENAPSSTPISSMPHSTYAVRVLVNTTAAGDTLELNPNNAKGKTSR